MFGRGETRPPPPQGRPPPYIFSRYYRYSLRPIVIGVGIAAALWALLWGISSFRSIEGDRRNDLGKLVVFDIVLGSLYMGVASIEIFGIWGAIKQSLRLIRIYAGGSLVALALTAGAEIIRIVVHFTFKNDLIETCSKILQSDGAVVESGFLGNFRPRNLTETQADRLCNSAWSKDTFTDFAWLIAALIFGLLFASIAYSYYRQLLDPSSMMTRTRNDAVPLNTFNGPYGGGPGNYYNNPYPPPEGRFGGPPGAGPGYSGHGQQQQPDYVPPYDNAKLPGYAGETRRSAEEEKKMAGAA